MNKTYTHADQPQMQAEVILASRSAERPNDKPLVTIRLRYPRIIHGEIMTHRVFSRNARSSRAVPVKTMLNEVRTVPFVPWHWGANQSGMQAGMEWNAPVVIPSDEDKPNTDLIFAREEVWLFARDRAVDAASAMMEAGYHKQIPNRLLEPFSWIDTLITSNQWENFLWLRDHKDAEPHLQDLARLVRQALDEMEVQELASGYWHTPYIKPEEYRDAPGDTFEEQVQFLCKISAARCARISYKPFDGDASYERELERYNMLVNSDRVHASPTEHQATPDILSPLPRGRSGFSWHHPELHGNLKGWIQARKLIPNEVHHG